MNLLFLATLALSTFGQTVVKRIELAVEPKTLTIRPNATAVIQVRVFGTVTDKEGKTKEGRLREQGWSIAVSPEADGGRFSKPFKFQGSDDAAFVDAGGSMLTSLFGNLAGQFISKDTVVYNAPAKPGKYKIEAKLGSAQAAVEVEVSDGAPAAAKPQRWTFGPEPAIDDPYRKLAEHYAPFVAQETWFDWKADALCRTDFDNDWDTGNNWDNLGEGSTQAYVYYAAIESKTHWYLIYNFFHARDYSDNCIAGTCHENDNEGVVVGVRKDGSAMGKLETLESLAHNNVYSYTNDPAIRNGAHNIEGKILFHNGSHPVVFLEAGGHGALGGGDSKSLFDPARMAWKKNTGITYVYKGVAERPAHAMDREVGYELLPIYHHWWARARKEQTEGSKMFSAFYNYRPFGNRPGMKYPEVAGSFLGIKHGRDKAKPFWGWHDMATQRRKILATGQWATDPAYAVSRNLTFPSDKPVSLDYEFNPYLNVPGPEPAFVEIVRNVTAGEVAVAGGVPPAPVPGVIASGGITAGSCEIELRVDGVVALEVQGSAAKYELQQGAPQEEKKLACTAPVPDSAALDFRLEKKSGRGSVRLTDTRKGRVEISDPSKGAGDYRIVLHWAPLN